MESINSIFSASSFIIGSYLAPSILVFATRDNLDYEWFSLFYLCEICTGCPSTSSDPPLDAAPVSAVGIFIILLLMAKIKQAAIPSYPL